MNIREKAISILKWTGYLTDESGDIMWKEFMWTDVTKKLLLVLQYSKGGLIGLTGLQGIGKTTTLHALRHKLKSLDEVDCAFVKWTSNWKETVSDDIQWEINADYDELLNNAYLAKTGLKLRSKKIEKYEVR